MVAEQIAARGVRSPTVLDAMGDVPRETFLPADLADLAYHDRPLPIGAGQTISQPYIVALMTEVLALSGSDRVLEVGTGSGYAAAVLSRIAAEVYTVERIAELAASATAALARLGYRNVTVLHGDGSLGWPEHAPYDAISVTAGGQQVPQALLAQLAVGGRLVMPVGANLDSQSLLRIIRNTEDDFERQALVDVRFVPLIGKQGWN